MKKKLFPIYIVACILLLCPSSLKAQVVSERNLPILSLYSARTQAFGGGNYACINDAYGVFYNPSMLANILYGGISTSYSYNQYGNSEILASYVRKEEELSLGVGLKTILSEVKTYSDDYITTKTSDDSLYYEASLTFALAYKLNDSSMIGVNAELIYTENEHLGMAFDASYTTSILLPAIRVAVGFEDLGFYDATFANFDTKLVAAAGYHPENGSFSIGATFKYAVPSLTPSFGVGAEVMILKFNGSGYIMNFSDDPEDILDNPPSKPIPNGLKLRAGLSDKDVSVGLGLNFFMMVLDYTVTFDNYALDNIAHTVSLNAFF